MKKVLVLVAVLGLVVGSVATADAAKKPQAIKFFFHGTETVGEIDMANNFAVGYNKMDTTEPSGPAPKSMGYITYVVGPNSDCAGNYIFPVWTGAVSGRIVGDMKVTFHSVSGPRAVDVRIWPDVGTQQCAGNDLADGQYPAPAAEATVDLPAGAGVVEVLLEDVNFTAAGSVMVQITPHVTSPVPGRVLYDAPDFASSLEFTCVPAKGSKSCTP